MAVKRVITKKVGVKKVTATKKGAVKLLAIGQKDLIVKIPALSGNVKGNINANVLTAGGTVSICCDVLSCSVK